MILSHYLWPSPIVFSENRIQTIVMENPFAFTEMIEMLRGQCAGREGEYVLSDNGRPFSFSKKVEMIVDLFSLDHGSKRWLTPLYKKLSAYASEEKYSETAEIMAGLKMYLLELFESTEHMLTFDSNFTVEKLLKALNVQIEGEDGTFLERLLGYMAIVCEFCGAETFFLVNLKCFLSEEDLDRFAKEMMLRKYHVLLLENTQREKEFHWEDLHLIDKDLCVIRF